MKVLVTGGAGFIGSHLVDTLIAKGHDVSVIDDLSGGTRQNLHRRARFYQFDLRNCDPFGEHAPAEFDFEVIYHLAANAAENKAQFSPVDVTSRNYDAFIRTLSLALRNQKRGGFRRFVFTSSIAVYGALQTPFKETDTPDPEDLYGISKLAIERSLHVMSKVHDFEFVIARPHNVYGPRQNMTDPYRNVVTIWMNALMQNKPYYIYGDGTQRRCFSYIDDVINALYKCGLGDVAGETFNIGSDKDYSLNELAETLGGAYGPIYLPERPQEVKVAIADHTEAKRQLGYEDTTTLQEGLRRTWDWAVQQGAQAAAFTPLEIPSPKAPKNWLQPELVLTPALT